MNFCFHPKWDVQQFLLSARKNLQVIKQFYFLGSYTVSVYTVKKKKQSVKFTVKQMVAVAKTKNYSRT